jgi:hypothetical protein
LLITQLPFHSQLAAKISQNRFKTKFNNNQPSQFYFGTRIASWQGSFLVVLIGICPQKKVGTLKLLKQIMRHLIKKSNLHANFHLPP